MPSRTKTVTFDNFSVGEFGTYGPGRAPRGSFTARNMMRYLDGSIGPRPGMVQLSPSGLGTGAVWGLCSPSVATANNVVFGQSNHVYAFTWAGASVGSVVDCGTVASTPTAVQQMIPYGRKVLLANYGDKAYIVTPATPTITAYASSPAGQLVAVYGVRMIDAQTASNINRVYYSAADDFTSWPALNYFNVPTTAALSFVQELRSRLAIATNENEWWALSGVPGVNDTLKRTPRADLAPASWPDAARAGESAHFISQGDDWPVEFTGTVTDQLRFRHLAAVLSATNNKAVATIPQTQTIAAVFSDNDSMLLRHNETWTKHALGFTPARLISATGINATSTYKNGLILTDGGGSGVTPKFYAFHPQIERPGKTADLNAQPGDGSTTPLDAYLYTPEQNTPDGTEATVRAVHVHFKKWNTGSSSTNHFDLTVRSTRRHGSDDRDSSAREWDEAPSLTTSDAEGDRVTLMFGDQGRGAGFQLRFDNVRGVAFGPIIVELDYDPALT